MAWWSRISRLQPGALNVIVKEFKTTFPLRRSLATWREKMNLGRWATKSILNES
jgi:hypothetical protein